MSLEDRVALITGSASGMGKQTALRMAKAGCAIVVNDINEEKLSATVEEFRSLDFQVIGVAANICTRMMCAQW